MFSQDVRLSHAGIVLKRLNMSSNIFHRRVVTPFLFFHTERYGNTATGTPRLGHRMQGVWINRDFRPISRFISEMVHISRSHYLTLNISKTVRATDILQYSTNSDTRLTQALSFRMILNDLAKYSVTWSTRGLSATAELVVWLNLY